MADIVSKKLAEVLNITDTINGEDSENPIISQNPLTNQPVYSSSLVTEADIRAYEAVTTGIGLEDFSRIILMKTAQKALNDHDELIEIMAKVDDSKAARMAEVAVSALGSASDSAKALLNHTLAKQKMELEKQKLDIKSVTINNIGDMAAGAGFTGTQKEIMDRIKSLMLDDGDDDDVPPLVEA